MADLIKKAYSDFQGEAFSKGVLSEFPKLELKQRIDHMEKMLKQYLPDDYEASIDILLNSLPPELDPTKVDDDFGDFIFAPLSEFVAQNGCDAKNYELSIKALKEMTKRFSVEGSIRYFINKFPQKTHRVMLELAQSDNYHQRRLASEGSRLKLPWAQKIVWEANDLIPILDQLYFDKTRYVTRSVANSMNDISKVDPRLALRTLKRWRNSGKQNKKEMHFIQKHSLRTLLKSGNVEALELFGFTDPSHIHIETLMVDKNVKMNQKLHFSFRLKTKDSKLGKIRVEYAIHFLKSNGKLSDKVFKIQELDCDKKTIEFKKFQSFKAMTTRKHYSGKHEIAILVNGKELARQPFKLLP